MRASVLSVLLILCLLLSLFPAYASTDWAETGVYTPRTASLLQRMATREGPSTGYAEPGSIISAGDNVSVLSLAYDVNDVPWVQVEFSYRGGLMRAYTGLKRVDIDAGLLPLDEAPVEARVAQTATAYRGPGTAYLPFSFTVPAGTEGLMYNREAGYAQFSFTDTEDVQHLVWIDMGQLVSDAPIPIATSGYTSQSSASNAHVIWTCQPYAGPGNTYAQYDYLVYSGTRGILYSVENGYAQFGYDPLDGGVRRIVWLPADFVETD